MPRTAERIKGDQYDFTVKFGTPPPEADAGTKANGRGANFLLHYFTRSNCC